MLRGSSEDGARTSSLRRLLLWLIPLVALAPTLVDKPASALTGGYRPPRIRPLIHPALAGEGVWQATGPAVRGGPPVLVTTFRPEPTSPGVLAYVGWIDHTRTQLAFYPGYTDPTWGSPRPPSMVPYGQRWRLLATFNGGFKPNVGAGGMAVNGRAYIGLQRGLGSVVGYRDGRVDVATWNGGPSPGRSIAFVRQNLPLIVNGGRPNPDLNDGPQWGSTLHGATYVWRTGVGIDRWGNLLFAAADSQTVRTLAAILIDAGAVRAIELDINPQWPTFITYRHAHGLRPDTFLPNYQQSDHRYLTPDPRDFFAVYRRVTDGSAGVPFR